MSPTDAHHRHTTRGVLLILAAVFMFSGMVTLGFMRRLSDASDQSGTH
jgi:hypothetical protein